ncbi:MAG TPA: hypothetical protein P5543_03035 [Planctomycetota bacterium]|nr:hypothetical protein [Planctomycetota bacterium]HRU51149.1 hypothetical protein [Planctomycetota bacterium]
MALLFDCPFCSYSKKVPDSYYNKKIKCPRCLATITLGLPQPTALTALALPEEDIPAIDQTAIEVEQSSIMMECPYCGECINTEEQYCPNCNQTIRQDEIPDSDVKKKRTYKTHILGFLALIPALGIIFGPFTIFHSLKLHPKNAFEKTYTHACTMMGLVGFMSSMLFCLALVKIILFT